MILEDGKFFSSQETTPLGQIYHTVSGKDGMWEFYRIGQFKTKESADEFAIKMQNLRNEPAQEDEDDVPIRRRRH